MDDDDADVQARSLAHRWKAALNCEPIAGMGRVDLLSAR